MAVEKVSEASKTIYPTEKCRQCPALQGWLEYVEQYNPYEPSGFEVTLDEVQINCWLFKSENIAHISGSRYDTYNDSKGKPNYIHATLPPALGYIPDFCPKLEE